MLLVTADFNLAHIFSSSTPGVTHFVLYNNSVGPDVTKVLRLYDSLGIIVVLKWNLPQGKKAVNKKGETINIY